MLYYYGARKAINPVNEGGGKSTNTFGPKMRQLL